MIPEFLPRRNETTQIAAFDDAYVVFDPRCNEVHLIEALSAVVFDACDGTESATVVNDIVEVLGFTHDAAERVIVDNLAEFERKGLIAGTAAAERPP